MKIRSLALIGKNLGFFLIPLLLISATSLKAQYKFQVSHYAHNGAQVLENSKGDFIVSSQNSDMNGGSEGHITCIAPTGTLKWSNRFHRGLGSTNLFSAICQLPDKGYMVLSTNNLNNLRPVLLRTDSLGNQLFVKAFDDMALMQNIGGNSMALLSNNKHLLIAGYRYQDGYLLKTDLNGTLVWGKTFDIPSTITFNYVKETKDKKNYIIAGTITNNKLFIMKTDTAGTMVWNHQYTLSKACKMYSFEEMDDGGFLLAANYDEATQQARLLLIKTDNNGIVQWNKAYYPVGTNLRVRCKSISRTPDNQFAVCGYYTPNTGVSRGFGMKVNATGNVAWAKTYNPGTTSAASMNGIVMAKDKGFFMAGSLSFNFYAIKTDSMGVSSCNETNITLKDTSFVISDTSYTAALSIQPIDTFSSYFNQFVEGGAYSIICSSVGIAVHDIVDRNISLYPNPANERISIFLYDEMLHKNLKLEVYSITGERVYKEDMNPGGQSILSLDLSGYAKGMYFVKLKTEGEAIRVGKISVQ